MAAFAQTVELQGGTVAEVSFAARYDSLLVKNLLEEGQDGAGIVWASSTSSQPLPGGDDCIGVDPGDSATIANGNALWYQGEPQADPGTSVWLICAAGTSSVVEVQGL